MAAPDPLAPLSDLQRIYAVEQWPHWPCLPLVHTREIGRCAVLIELGFSKRFALIEANLFDREALRTSKRVLITPEQVIADGWRVD